MNQYIKWRIPRVHHQLFDRIRCRMKQVWFLNLLTFFTQLESSIRLQECDLHTPYQVVSGPGNQGSVTATRHHCGQGGFLCFVLQKPEILPSLSSFFFQMYLFRKKKRETFGHMGLSYLWGGLSSWGLDCWQDLPQTAPPQGFKIAFPCPRPTPRHLLLLSLSLWTSCLPHCCAHPAVGLSCCISSSRNFSFFHGTTRDSKMRTCGQLGTIFCGGWEGGCWRAHWQRIKRLILMV